MMRSEFGSILQQNSYDYPSNELYSSPDPDTHSNIFLNNHKDSSGNSYSGQVFSKNVGLPQPIKVERHDISTNPSVNTDKGKKKMNSTSKMTTSTSKAQIKPKK